MKNKETKEVDEELSRLFPDIHKRLWHILKRPTISRAPVTRAALLRAFVDLALPAWGLGGVVGFISSHAPGFLDIDPNDLINWNLFGTMLIVNAIGFAIVLYLLSLLPMYWKTKQWNLQLICHTLRAFALINFFVAFLFVFGTNQLAVNGTIVPTSGPSMVVLWVLVLGVFALSIRVLFLPFARYCRVAFHSKTAFVGGVVVVLLALKFNPIIAGGYFSHIVEEKEFCATLMPIRYRKELEAGLYSRECLIVRCEAVAEGKALDSRPEACQLHHRAGLTKDKGS